MARYLTVVALLAVFLSCGTQPATAEDDCSGPIVKVSIQQPDLQAELAYGALAGFGGNLTEPLVAKALVIASPVDACNAVAPVPSGALVLVIRGTCSFTDKALAVQNAGGAAMLLYDNEPGCVTMGFDPNNATIQQIVIPSISITDKLGSKLRSISLDGVTLSIAAVKFSKFDASAIMLWFLAIGTVWAGSVWGGQDYLASKRLQTHEDDMPLLHGGASNQEIVDITPKAAVAFVFIASGMLLLLFFFLNQAFFYVLLCIFCFASIQAITTLLVAGGSMLSPQWKNTHLEINYVGSVPILGVGAFPIAVAISVVWAVYRNSAWSWILQDIQGVALMLLVMRTLRLSSMKVAYLLLSLCFVYDVFWVFIQPMLFGGGKSVMVEVAEGGSSHEYIPMLLRVPRLSNAALSGYSMLGFGDIILPGLLVAYMRRLDLDAKLHGFMGYFYPTLLAYAGGLFLTYVALVFSWFGDQGQPALLYLVPCTLGTVTVLSYARGDMASMFKSKRYAALGYEDHDSDSGGPAMHYDVESSAGGAHRNSRPVSDRTGPTQGVHRLPSQGDVAQK